MPAEKFRVKNGGQNHGRWFYTCQKPQPKRCPFFLWSDDAKIREEAAVLNNSRNEPGVDVAQEKDTDRAQRDWIPEEAINAPKTPRTPMRQSKITQPITPISNMKPLRKTPSPSRTARSNTLSPRSPSRENHDESFDWSSSADDELAEFADSLDAKQSHDADAESPRKSIKTTKDDSPSKRRHTEIYERSGRNSPLFDSETSSTWLITTDDLPSTPTKSSGQILTPGTTPAQAIAQSQPHTHPPTSARQPAARPTITSEDPSPLALEALSLLSPINPPLPVAIEQSLVSLLNRHDLRTQGIQKGREIARAAIQTKEKKITELQQRIASLEAERETSRVVIQHLKSDIAKSPVKKGGGFRRSEI